MQLTGPAAGMIAPVIAGLTYTAVGVVGTIVIDLLSFGVAILTIFLVRIPKPPQTEAGRAAAGRGLLRSAFAGFGYLWARKPLLALVAMFGLVNALIGGVMSIAMPYLILRTGSEASAGLVVTLGSLGMFVGGVLFGIWGGTRPRIHTILPALIFGGVMVMVFGLGQALWVLAVVHFLTLFPLPAVNSPAMSILQAKTAPDMQGRVFAAIEMISMALMPLSYLIYAPLADRVLEPMVGTAAWAAFAPVLGNGAGAGMGLLFVVAGGLMAVVCCVTYLMPSIRHMERDLPDHVADAPAPDAEAGVEVGAAPAPAA
jgi:hypothetical protein